MQKGLGYFRKLFHSSMQCEEVYKVETTYGRVFGALAHIAGLAHGGCLLYHPTLCTQAGLFSGGGVR